MKEHGSKKPPNLVLISDLVGIVRSEAFQCVDIWSQKVITIECLTLDPSGNERSDVNYDVYDCHCKDEGEDREGWTESKL
jgi:hypothetical protein